MRSARIGVNSAYDDIGNQSAFGDVVQVGAAKTRASNAALQAPDLTDQIIKSVAAAELKRKKVGSTRESMFVSERPSPAQMDADRKKSPALNQYTPKPKPPGGA
jgi:hypothetical protein